MRKTLFVLTTFIFTGCASQKALTPVELVQGAQDSVDKTNEYVERANTTINNFEKSIHELLKEASNSDKMRGKARFNEALTAMDRKIAESRMDLAILKVKNAESWEAYKARLDSAKKDMHETFKEETE